MCATKISDYLIMSVGYGVQLEETMSFLPGVGYGVYIFLDSAFRQSIKYLTAVVKKKGMLVDRGGDGAAGRELWVTDRKSRGQCVKSNNILFGMRNTAENNRTLSILFKVIMTIHYLG